MSVYLTNCLFIWWTVCLFNELSVYLTNCLFIWSSICIFVLLSVCLYIHTRCGVFIPPKLWNDHVRHKYENNLWKKRQINKCTCTYTLYTLHIYNICIFYIVYIYVCIVYTLHTYMYVLYIGMGLVFIQVG